MTDQPMDGPDAYQVYRGLPRNITPINYRSGDTTPLHPVGATDPRINRLLPAGLIVGTTGAGLLLWALTIESFVSSAFVTAAGAVLFLTAGVILWAWEGAKRDHSTGSDLDVEDWQRDR